MALLVYLLPLLELFSYDLETDLGLSGASAKKVRSALGRHGNGGQWDKDPGFLWKLAAELQEKLSDEEKAKIFARMERSKKNDKDGKEFDRRNQKKDGKDTDNFRLVYSVLTDEQKAEFDEIMRDFRTQMGAVGDKVKADEMTKEEAGEVLKALHESLKSAIDALLTDQQKAELEQMKEKLETKRKEFAEAVEAAKTEALGLTDEQIASFEALRANTKAAMDSLKEKVESGEMTREEAGEAMKEIMENRKTQSAEILTEIQIEIIKIHAYLQMRWHHRHGPRGGDGDGRGGRGG